MDKPEAIMINVPQAFFRENSEAAFRRFYEKMGVQGDGSHCFYHFISIVPVHEVTTVYVCFNGFVQYKAIMVECLKNTAPFEEWPKRNWLIATGPVQKAPAGMVQKGFRGFRYCKELF